MFYCIPHPENTLKAKAECGEAQLHPEGLRMTQLQSIAYNLVTNAQSRLTVSLIANTAEQLLIIIYCVKGKERESEVNIEIIKIQASASALLSFNLLTFIYNVQGVKPLLC